MIEFDIVINECHFKILLATASPEAGVFRGLCRGLNILIKSKIYF